MKTLIKAMLATIAAASFTMLSAPAQAAEYYNCSNPNGCKLVKSKNQRNTMTQTQYPVVMAHGLGGWTSLFGLLDYFNGIPEALMKGGTDVYTTKTSAIHNGEVRGEQLLKQVQTIVAVTGKEKVNLFGHSHGGSDIRYVAAVAPQYVASVTAVSSPAQGSKMADWVIKQVEEGSAADGYPEGEYNPASRATLGFFKFVGGFMDVGSSIRIKDIQEQDSWEAITSLSTEYMADYFNPKFSAAMPTEYCGQPPANNVVNGIPYYSFSGVGTILNPLDPSDYLMGLTAIPFGDDPNDGLVSACSSRVGHVIRDNYKMNHLDTVNQVLGFVAWGQANPISVYRNQVNRLKNQNL